MINLIYHSLILHFSCMIDYSYLTPPRNYKLIKFSKNQIYENVKDNPIRRIFNNNHYEQFQRNQIKQIKQYLNKKAPNITYPDQLLLRFCYLGNFMMNSISNIVLLYDQWHQNQHITTITKQGRQILEYGHIYTYGRDDYYCPIIIVRPNMIDLKKFRPDSYQNAIYGILEPIQRFMLVGGYIEKWNVIVDFQHKKCTLNLVQIKNSLKKLMYAYPFRLKRLLFINTKHINQVYISEMIGLLDDKNQLVHVQVINNNDLLNKFSKQQQRQKKYGGSLLNLSQYWPIHTTSKHEEKEDESITQTEYQSVANDAQFFGQNQHPMCNCMDSKCVIY